MDNVISDSLSVEKGFPDYQIANSLNFFFKKINCEFNWNFLKQLF